MGVGIVLIVVGILGFIPGITTQYNSLAIIGPNSTALFLGLFQVSMLLNVIQALIGTIGVVMSRNNPMGARNFLMGFGLLYVVLSVYSLIVGVGAAANFLSLNVMGAWGFMILGVAMVLAGWLMSRHLADDAKTR
ncbi:hypothetical protein NicSoilB4_08660 [Arthrobacter sp. NicSoilB4]|uniref:DUF4383 domain-containing protein n=1 Tax=Arthrobacter sp. NicSoilB4 TaxID=2830997 RepID=UPI001E73BFB0|nr:DUF4383 domain-containing protein [Arthrobacter sp. NicSoilB4]BCW66103.1 hypothetical protein NicSoilB4_08660 [Arthrobacter sp. NicSoilB4]